MSVTYRPQKIEIETPGHAQAWAAELGVSVRELLTAVNAVGTSLEEVKAYLSASQEPMGAYVDKMRSRLDEIEVQFQQLSDERRSIVAFLEGFAQVQRTYRQGGPGSSGMLTISLSEKLEALPPDHRKHFEELAFPNANRHAALGSSVAVVEVVYRLLSDGKRRSLQEILSFLEVRGVPLKGANPAGFLSTLLSRDHRFDANRRDGWGLTGRHE